MRTELDEGNEVGPMRQSISERWHTAFRRTTRNRDGLESSWKTLDLVLSLIKHAETKAIATLAAAGVLGQILFALVQPQSGKIHTAVLVLACVCAVFVTGAGTCAVCVLWPRLKSGDPTLNLLYFGDLAADRRLTRDRYVRAISELSRRPDDIVEHVAAQVWANSEVAQRKYRFANIAVGCLLAAVLALAITALMYVVLAQS
ncbi:Pycsar system effector family protein [Nocardia sp. CA-119907]|uniref:Pycsar system effector family protein n=1 Tax=Nocardia sp. CA-119907 TaxID=3239973 RepID=UPI003D99152E